MPPRINIPPLTRGLLILLFICTVLNASLRYREWAPGQEASFTSSLYNIPYLVLVPAQSLIYPWTHLTSAFIEQNVVSFLVAGATLFFGGRYLERAWSSAEFAKFVLFASMIPNLLAFGTYTLWFMLAQSEARASTSINGGVAIQAAFLVAFKQLVPEHTVAVFRGLVRMRVKHFPALFLLANTLSGVVFGTDTALFLAWYGVLTSWTYLRFYRTTPSAGDGGPALRGDASETFAFAHFFPEPLQTLIATLVTLRICTPFSDEDVDAGNEQASARAEGGLPNLMNPRGGRGGGRREEAERRRALALKALDQRLSAAAIRPAPVAAAAAVGSSAAGATNHEAERNDDRGGEGGDRA
ncbi:eukaryotic integral membrane protein-domain-containing protein [Cryomyces antarcticus]